LVCPQRLKKFLANPISAQKGVKEIGDVISKERNGQTGYKIGYEEAHAEYSMKSIKLPADLFQEYLKTDEKFQKTFDIG
jgi:hypothetical protein